MSIDNSSALPSMRLELVLLPVADVDLSKAFYVEKMGFHADHDVTPSATMRVVQLTPPGSACSIAIGTGLGLDDVPPGSVRGLHLVVDDVAQVREILAGRGVEVGEIIDMGGIKYVFLSDPDGNSWELQQIPNWA